MNEIWWNGKDNMSQKPKSRNELEQELKDLSEDLPLMETNAKSDQSINSVAALADFKKRIEEVRGELVKLDNAKAA